MRRRCAASFGAGSAVAIAVLVATAAAMASHLDRRHDDTLRLKLALVLLVACCSACQAPGGR